MRNQFSKLALLLAASGALAPALHAGDPSRFDVGGAVIGGLGTLQKQGGMKSGVSLDGGWTMSVSDTSRSRLRVGFAVSQFMGSDENGVDNTGMVPVASTLKTSLTSYQASSDLLLPMGNTNFSYVLGLSLSKYAYKTTGAAPGVYSSLGIDHSTFDPNSGTISGDANGSGSWPGLKFGFRMGVEYDITSKVAMNVLFQQTEFGRADAFPQQRRSLNPAWLQVGVKYSF